MRCRQSCSPENTSTQFVTIITVAVMELIQKAVSNFNLHCPTPEEVDYMLLYSTKHY
ncbi:family B DNA polymerase [Klebsiella pneumoniae]